MNRVIKFRAWADGYMHEDISTVTDSSHNGIVPHENTILMQYIGLEDKNKNPIYEGDVLLVQWIEDEEDWEKVEVVWWDAGFRLLYDGVGYDINHQDDFYGNRRLSDIWDDPSCLVVEVIGNIYTKPEWAQ